MAARAAGLVNKLKLAATDMALMAKPAMQTYGSLAMRELGPPSPAQWPTIQKDLQGLVKSAKSLKFINVSVKEAVTGALLGAEVLCWFYVGEIIGRGSIIGYNV
ncbi:hypothetical protein PTSG_05225 [Salpingoeca rosetta]|uniref:ATP synthase subunit n=1 Tax=Salpingoeca rosetta (strain ATCC 50818 / BSB-021) TaxID=946362 RepID=F2UAV5_SALR5|nr:uncharacterized protein PTSG_05225 [Salpingoeca rosetta]EGD73521.1 hypothetical protein PTSG_05225 [Salpingoeca rosetta]|eukprot:XP_004993803.1 hypothetical protein PTSG_05225 [Salpingoeca rosetta]